MTGKNRVLMSGTVVRTLVKCWIHAAVVFLCISCAGAPVRDAEPAIVPPVVHAAAGSPEAAQAAVKPVTDSAAERVAANAVSLIGLSGSSIGVDGRKYMMDCTGVVLASYAKAGINLDREFGRYPGNGVERLYRTMVDSQLVYETKIPAVGDIVFWDNTYDKNGDGKWNDLFTHVGIIVESGADGRVAYVHHNYVSGIVREYMDLLHEETYTGIADGKTVVFNSPLRMKSHRYLRPEKWLSSHLYKDAAKAYLYR